MLGVKNMNPIDQEELESILHRLIVDIAKDKEVFYRMSTKQSFVELCVMMRHLFQPKTWKANKC